MRASGEMEARIVIHAALTTVMGWLGFILMVPGSTFATGHSFELMSELASEEAWALLFWAATTIGIIGLGTRSDAVRVGSVLLLATMHGMVATCMLLGSPLSTGSGTYAIIAGLGYYLAWRRVHGRG